MMYPLVVPTANLENLPPTVVSIYLLANAAIIAYDASGKELGHARWEKAVLWVFIVIFVSLAIYIQFIK
jgi:hypothetical protein